MFYFTSDFYDQTRRFLKGAVLLGGGVFTYVGLSKYFKNKEPITTNKDSKNAIAPYKSTEQNPILFAESFQPTSFSIFTGRTLLSIPDIKEGNLEVDVPSKSTRREIQKTAQYHQGGCEFQVNSYTTNDQERPTVAGLKNGGFVITWYGEGQGQVAGFEGIYGQLYNSSGVRIGTEFQVNSYTTNGQHSPTVAGLDNGGFVVMWSGNGQDPSYSGIYGQLYNSSGVRIGTEFQVNSYTTAEQDHPAVAGLENGGFVVTWQSFGQEESISRGIYGQLYNSSGIRIGTEFQVNSYTTNNQMFPSIAGLKNGGFVVTWFGYGQDPSGEGIYGQLYDSSGSRVGTEFQVNSYTTNGQYNPSVADLENGGFVITWRGAGQGSSGFGVYGQLYNSSGGRIGTEFQINTYTTSEPPTVAGLKNGGFVVTWYVFFQDLSSYNIYGQLYNSSGGKIGTEFQVNSYMINYQRFPTVAGLKKGGFVVTWSGDGQDPSGYGVYGRISASGPCVIANKLTINEGETILINSTMLNANTLGFLNSAIDFTIRNVQHGRFEKTNNPGITITSFTQQEILDGEIQFVHDGGEIAPSYEVKVSDGIFETGYQNAAVFFENNVNDAPVLRSNKLTITQGETVALTSHMLNTTDVDNDDDLLGFIFRNVTYGRFEIVNDPGIAITNFIQQDIFNSRIRFVHDGTKNKPSYEVKVSDGQLETSWSKANITFYTVNPSKNPSEFPYQYLIIGSLTLGICLLCTSTTLFLITASSIYIAKNLKTKSKKAGEIELLDQSQLGDFLAKYQVPHKEIEVIEHIGTGASATVYKAKWENKIVAYKQFPVVDPEKIKDFEIEAKIMLESNHPNIIRLYRVAIRPGGFGLLMEYMEMGTLKEVLAKKEVPLTWSAKWNIACDLASVLKFLHEKNVFHRDVKTDNVLLYREGNEIHAKMADFGLSKAQETDQSVTMAIGTYKYMAPEMTQGDDRYGTGKFPMDKVDIYALGMTYVALIIGQEPYRGEKNTLNIPARVSRKELVQEIPQHKCPKEFLTLTNQCRDIDLEKRPTAEKVVLELEKMKKEVITYKEEVTEETEIIQKIDDIKIEIITQQAELDYSTRGLCSHELEKTIKKSGSENVVIQLLDNIRQEKVELSAPTIKSSQFEFILKQLENQVKVLQQQNKDNTKVKSQIQELTTKQQVLWKDYQQKQIILDQQNYINNQAELSAFYKRVQLKLTELFLACKVINSGLVKRNPDDKTKKALDTTSKIAGAVKTVTESSLISLGGQFLDLAVPGLGLATKIGAKVVGIVATGVHGGTKIANKIHAKQEETKITRISHLASSLNAMDKLIEETARRLTLKYEEQIRCLTTEKNKKGLKEFITTLNLAYNKENGGAENLAECAVARMLVGIKSGVINFEKKQSLVEQLLQIVFVTSLKLGTLGLKQMAIETKDKKIHKNWIGKEVFQKPGIKTRKGNYYSYYKNSSIKKACGDPDKYGYRLGTKEEAEELKLTKQLQQTKNIGFFATQKSSSELSLEVSGDSSVIDETVKSFKKVV